MIMWYTIIQNITRKEYCIKEFSEVDYFKRLDEIKNRFPDEEIVFFEYDRAITEDPKCESEGYKKVDHYNAWFASYK